MSNGAVSDREWQLLIDKIDGVAVGVASLQVDVRKLTTDGAEHHVALSSLPCSTNTMRLSNLEAESRDLRDRIRYRLGWKAMVVAIIPALTAGVMLGAKYL